MNLLSRRTVLAVAAVVDISLNSKENPVAAKALAVRHKLPPRHLETLLQGLVHAKILKGVRGPRGGYQLAREDHLVSVGDIARVADELSTADPADMSSHSKLLGAIIEPKIHEVGKPFLKSLNELSIEDLRHLAEKAHLEEKTPAHALAAE